MPLLNFDNFTIKDELIPAERLASMVEADQPMDPRFLGKNPPAHSGLGYGCLTASLPMNETRPPR